MGIQLNSSARREFDYSRIEEIAPDERFLIWSKKDPFGRECFGVGDPWNMAEVIREDTDLSRLEWDMNEVYISGEDKELLFEEAVGIIKGWRKQLTENYPEDRFVAFASYDDGSEMLEGCERIQSFTLRFWKKREGMGLDENTEFEQPVIKWCNHISDILAESEHFYILGSYEAASLYRKPDSKYVACVGDFYGDPEDAYIDPEERFCITIGCGIIKYNLCEPFEEYRYDRETPQWIETGREGNIEWCDRIDEVTDSYISVSLNGEDKRKFNINTLELMESF